MIVSPSFVKPTINKSRLCIIHLLMLPILEILTLSYSRSFHICYSDTIWTISKSIVRPMNMYASNFEFIPCQMIYYLSVIS